MSGGVGAVEINKVENTEGLASSIIGAGASLVLTAHEVLKTVRVKLDETWPAGNDSTSARCLKILASGVILSVTAIAFWKIYKRFCPPKDGAPPSFSGDDIALRYYGYSMLDDSVESLRQGGEKDKAQLILGVPPAAVPLDTLPHKIQVRISETPRKTDSDNLCKTAACCTTDEGGKSEHQSQPSAVDISSNVLHTATSSGCGDSTAQSLGTGTACAVVGHQSGSGGQVVPASRRVMYTVVGRHVIIQAADYIDPRVVNAALFGNAYPPVPALPYCNCHSYQTHACHGHAPHRPPCRDRSQEALYFPPSDGWTSTCVMSNHAAMSTAGSGGSPHSSLDLPPRVCRFQRPTSATEDAGKDAFSEVEDEGETGTLHSPELLEQGTCTGLPTQDARSEENPNVTQYLKSSALHHGSAVSHTIFSPFDGGQSHCCQSHLHGERAKCTHSGVYRRGDAPRNGPHRLHHHTHLAAEDFRSQSHVHRHGDPTKPAQYATAACGRSKSPCRVLPSV